MNRKLELVFVVAFIVVNLAAPFVFRERFPFTISPMFCDQPRQYATYEITDPRGDWVDPKWFGLHLVYDGNPPGLGMGIAPKPTLHEFGECVDDEVLVEHVQHQLGTNPHLAYLNFVRVHCRHVCCQEHELHREHKSILVFNPAWDPTAPRELDKLDPNATTVPQSGDR